MRALDFATEAHKGQVRKYTGAPYITHPMAVAKIVGDCTSVAPGVKPLAKAAAYLHDVVEDCGVPLSKIEDEFGKRVAKLVFFLTDISKPSDGNRAFRKQLDRWHISKAPRLAQTIKLADMLDNTESILAHDPNFAVVYLKEKHLLLGEMKAGDWRLRTRCNALLTNTRHIWDRS